MPLWESMRKGAVGEGRFDIYNKRLREFIFEEWDELTFWESWDATLIKAENISDSLGERCDYEKEMWNPQSWN